jgi:HSP20 family protein
MTKLTLRRPAGSLFTDFFPELEPLPTRLGRLFDGATMLQPVGWMPPVEIEERENELLLTMELPGMMRENVDVLFEDGALTIKGERTEEKEEKKERRLHIWERQYGAFQRSFTLPRTIDGAKITAEFKRGVLNVHLPIVADEKVRGRKIEVAEVKG